MASEIALTNDISRNLIGLEVVDWTFSNTETTYLTHGLHPYPAKFIPQLPYTLINALSHPGETVADIFCGSGTTLVESLLLGRNAIGIDANPLACLISEAKTARFDEGDEDVLYGLAKRAQELADALTIQGKGSLFGSEPFISQAPRPDHEALSFWFEPFVVEELAEMLAWCRDLPRDASRKVALTAFSSIVVAVSKQDSDTRYVRREKNLMLGEPLRRFARALRDAVRAVAAFNREVAPDLTCNIYNTNILQQPAIDQIDLMVCSPPYPNAYSYHLYHMTRMIWLGMDQPKFKREEIGSHRKYSSKGPNGATAETFGQEMTTILTWLYEHLRTDRYACFVVGDSTIRGEKVSNADLIAEIAQACGFREADRFHREMVDTKKAFNPAIGKIKGEHILILQKIARTGFRMTHTFRCKIKPYIQPFERKLALEELSVLAGSEPEPVASPSQSLLLRSASPQVMPVTAQESLEFEVSSEVPLEKLVQKLAYWESVSAEEKCFTTQVLREATMNVVRNGIRPDQIAQHLPFRRVVPLPNRRNLRYGTHGIHEYRGKFFPQLVRALMNIAEVPENGIVADPMCGSGTTVVEAILSGYCGLGLDYNPLSVLMSQTKCALLSVDPELLIREHQAVSQALQRAPTADTSATLPYFMSLSSADQKYLAEWFSERVLRELDRIASMIYAREADPVRNLMLLALSNIIRRVSWQKEEDLRVRKEVRPDDDIDPVREFLTELNGSIKSVVAFLYQNRGMHLGTFDICESDARSLGTTWDEFLGRVDVVITSPPYATALPYLDTDRLSLYYLGLLSRAEHRRRDRDMIGNREITEKHRQSYLQRFRQEQTLLPERAVQVIERIHELNSTTSAGFRRRNMPALLTKYFLDMHEVLRGIAQLLRPGGYAYIVVGDNHTIAGGQRVEIETANILRDMALTVGLEQGLHLPMDMLTSREIFSHNAVASETILSLRRCIAQQ